MQNCCLTSLTFIQQNFPLNSPSRQMQYPPSNYLESKYLLLLLVQSLLNFRMLARFYYLLAACVISPYPYQGRKEVRWRPGQKPNLAPPCSNLRSFASKCTVLKKVLVTLLGLFDSHRSYSAPEELCPLSPLVTPLPTSSSTVGNKRESSGWILVDKYNISSCFLS